MEDLVLRILIADDSAMVRRGVIGLLSSEASWEICGEASDGSEALLKARTLVPDVILLDVSMPGLNGLEVARRLRKEVPQAKIIVMSQHDPAHLLPGVMAAGGDACLDKSRLAADLVDSIRNLHPRDQQPAASK
jgi:two-component system, NarL family, response regulator DesR